MLDVKNCGPGRDDVPSPPKFAVRKDDREPFCAVERIRDANATVSAPVAADGRPIVFLPSVEEFEGLGNLVESEQALFDVDFIAEREPILNGRGNDS